MSVKALYPGTFDPPTNGHVDLIQRGSKLFEHLTVGILNNPVKNPLFTVEERVEMLSEATRSLDNVSVATFDGMTVEFARQLGAKAVLRGMIKARHGRIINIGSVVGTSGNAGQTNYAAAKAALIGFTKSLAQEVGGRSITVNCVAPGFIDTDMTRALSAEQREHLIARIPLGRLGLPEDVAHAVLFLASREAGYITGATLHVNGGMYMA